LPSDAQQVKEQNREPGGHRVATAEGRRLVGNLEEQFFQRPAGPRAGSDDDGGDAKHHANDASVPAYVVVVSPVWHVLHFTMGCRLVTAYANTAWRFIRYPNPRAMLMPIISSRTDAGSGVPI
jgi:hypothetical protein